jgi:O-acetyl-ADP-ribose deacetylase (regulator of RNase III)
LVSKGVIVSISDGYVEVVQGDITRQEVDAIVNAANNRLAGGGGVDGAIHRVAGPELDAACRAIGWCDTGDAVITSGFRLPATWIIHTVGPVWHGGDRDEDALLASCYRASMELAHERGIRSIAFPSISTGVYGFPVKRAARIAIDTLRGLAIQYPEIRTVRMVTHGADTYSAYADELEATMD